MTRRCHIMEQSQSYYRKQNFLKSQTCHIRLKSQKNESSMILEKSIDVTNAVLTEIYRKTWDYLKINNKMSLAKITLITDSKWTFSVVSSVYRSAAKFTMQLVVQMSNLTNAIIEKRCQTRQSVCRLSNIFLKIAVTSITWQCQLL